MQCPGCCAAHLGSRFARLRRCAADPGSTVTQRKCGSRLCGAAQERAARVRDTTRAPPLTLALERDEMRLGPFSSRGPDAAQQECCEPGSTLLCMGLFSRFFVQALPCTAEGTLCRVRDTKSLAPRAYGTNRSNSNTSCSSVPNPKFAIPRRALSSELRIREDTRNL